MNSRADLRQRMRTRRRTLDPSRRSSAADCLARHLCAHSLFRNSQRIACYWPVDGEVDTAPIISRIWTANKECYLPVLNTLNGNSLWFAPFRDGDRMVYNLFGIPEPAVAMRSWVRARNLDLVLTPLVAFDQRGHRLGMGSGFYDRTLSFLNHRVYWQRPMVLGIAYELQRVPRLVCRPWDVPMHGIATEAAVYLVERGRAREGAG